MYYVVNKEGDGVIPLDPPFTNPPPAHTHNLLTKVFYTNKSVGRKGEVLSSYIWLTIFDSLNWQSTTTFYGKKRTEERDGFKVKWSKTSD